MEAQQGYEPVIVRRLIDAGYTTVDLFGLTHIFIGRRT